MEEEVTVKYPRRFAFIGAVIGAAVLWMALDLRFFRLVDGWDEGARDSWVVFLIVFVIGSAFFFPSVKALLSPPVVLTADRDGVTVFAVRSDDEWNESSGGFRPVLKPGDPRRIAWDQIESIETWMIPYGGRGGLQGRTRARMEIESVRLLIDREVELDGFTREGIIHARTGTAPEDVSSEDREHFSERELEDYMRSEILLSGRIFSGGARALLGELERLKAGG